MKLNMVALIPMNGRFSKIKVTENEIPFDEYWNDSDSADFVNDWDRIKQRVIFDVKCSDCGKHTQVHFRPDGRKPVYCEDCWRKHR